MDWIDLTQNRVTWWALMDAVIKLRVPYIAENFLGS
jgi:hypothetical protein